MCIVELRLKQATPALIGYYVPELVDDLYFLRPTSLKGIWRWTARTLIAGILYDEGFLIGQSTKDFVKIPTNKEVEVISYLVGHEIGLGYVKDEGAEASAFRLLTYTDHKPHVITMNGRRVSQLRLQRLTLLTLRKRTLQSFENGLFTVKLLNIRRMEDEKLELAVRLLVLALTIMGLGKGSRRGLGSFDIIEVRGLKLERNFREFLEATYKLAELVVSTSPLVRRLRKESVKGLPPMPAFSKSTYMNRPISIIYSLSDVRWMDIHNFFLRGARSKGGMDPLTTNKYAWILGLPRSQRGTGYMVLQKEVRRASPVLVTVHSRHVFDDVRNSVLVTFLTSSDWPTQLTWIGAFKSTIKIDEALIVNAMNQAENSFLNFVGKPNLTPLWPSSR